MEAFLKLKVPHDDPALAHCYEHLSANLDAIVDLADKSGPAVVLCTVPTNIRSCAPFGAQNAADLSKDAAAKWRTLFDEGRKLQDNKQFSKAMAKYLAASEIDDEHAELAYAMGQCAEQTGDLPAAAKYCTLARDRDTLRSRADSRVSQSRVGAGSRSGRRAGQSRQFADQAGGY